MGRKQTYILGLCHEGQLEIGKRTNKTPHSGGASSSRSSELLGGILATNYSQIADHSNRVFYTTIVISYAAVFSVA